METTLIRDADVKATETRDSEGHTITTINVNDQFEHTFDRHSRLSKALDVMPADDISARLTGGSYFFINDELYDFRDGQYSGFIHSDDSISRLVEHVGITALDSKNKKRDRVHENVVSRDFSLGKKWSDHNISVPGYQDGGEFESQLRFGWSPFSNHVNSAFMLYRLVCENGMRGLRSFMSTKIPLLNRWEEHLDIANRQIQHKVNNIVTDRVQQMGKERASVAEAGLIAHHASTRIARSDVISQNDLKYLNNIADIATPSMHLGNVYRENVFTDTNIGAQLPSHLTTLDVYNMATEIRTHTKGVDKSTDHALDRLANDLMFDHKSIIVGQFSGAPKSSFSDPDAAFYGMVS